MLGSFYIALLPILVLVIWVLKRVVDVLLLVKSWCNAIYWRKFQMLGFVLPIIGSVWEVIIFGSGFLILDYGFGV